MRNRKPDVTEEVVNKFRELEAQGKSRSEIALMTGYSKSVITRKLGAVRAYRGFRTKEAA